MSASLPESGFERKRERWRQETCAAADPQERLSRFVEVAKQTPRLGEDDRVEAHLVPGCLAKLWLVPELRDGLCWYRCDSDSLVVKGVAILVCGFFSGESPEAILAFSGDPLRDVGIDRHLSQHRRNGLGKLRGLILDFARSCPPSSS